jgi:hypothetical protein
MAEFLALMDVRNVHLDHRPLKRVEGIEDCDRGVGEGRRIDDDSARRFPSLVDPVDDLVFPVRGPAPLTSCAARLGHPRQSRPERLHPFDEDVGRQRNGIERMVLPRQTPATRPHALRQNANKLLRRRSLSIRICSRSLRCCVLKTDSSKASSFLLIRSKSFLKAAESASRAGERMPVSGAVVNEPARIRRM